MKEEQGRQARTPIWTADDMKELVEPASRTIYKREEGRRVPAATRRSSCMEAIKAVFRSWDNPRAIVLPPHERHPLLDWGTAVNVQTMVFGNMGDDFRHRRCVHPRPRHRREEAVRRVPDQCAGRGRRRRHPHPADHRPAAAGHARSVRAVRRTSRIRWRTTTATCRIWSSPSSTASSTCSRPVTASAPRPPR